MDNMGDRNAKPEGRSINILIRLLFFLEPGILKKPLINSMSQKSMVNFPSFCTKNS